MKRLLAVLAMLCLSGLASAAERPPNIVLILSDDQAWTDYGFMGHDAIKTPHLDKLAERSILFERGYVASPLCRPSLASMVTGRFPFDHRVTGNDVDGENNRAALDIPVRVAFHQLPSFVRMLTANGYVTHQSGKWWEGSFGDGGFTHGMTHGDPKRGGRHGDDGLEIGRAGMAPVTDFIDMAAKEEKPFLVWYAPFLPHTPHNPPQRLLEKYTATGRAEDVAKYYAMCEWFDETCGQLLGHLESTGLSENTMVIYICDNGWAARSTNSADPNQKLWSQFAQKSKGSPWDLGIRTPIMVSWPGHLKAGRSQDLAHAIDLFPTIAAATGLETPKDLPGINLMDEKARGGRDTVFGVCNSVYNMSPENPDETLQYLWCVSGDWKLLIRCDGKDTTQFRNLHVWDKQPVRLHNLREDPFERNEISSAHPEIVDKLRKKIEAWHRVPKG